MGEYADEIIDQMIDGWFNPRPANRRRRRRQMIIEQQIADRQEAMDRLEDVHDNGLDFGALRKSKR